MSASANARPATAAKPAVPAIQFLRKPGRAAELDQQQAHAAHHMQREQHHEAPLGELEQPLVGEAQEAVQRGLAVERLAERPEMQRQERGEREARQALDQERPVRRVVARAKVVARASSADHRVDGAQTQDQDQRGRDARPS